MMQPFSAFLLVPLLLLGPGYGLLPESFPRRLRLPFVVFVSFGVMSITALGMVFLGCFSVPWLVVFAVGFLVLRLRSGFFPGLNLSKHRVVLLLLTLLAVFAFLTAGEPFDANGDSGVYAIAAQHVIRSGSWTWPLGALVPEGMPLDLVISTPNLVRSWSEIAPGFPVVGGTVSPQFFPLYPLWGAVFGWFFGTRGLLAANLLGVLLLLFGLEALSRLFLRGFLPLLVLLVAVLNPVFLIFLKYPSAEVFLAGILAGWLYWTVLFLRSPAVRNALVPAILISLAMVTKFFAWAVMGVLGVILVMLGTHRWRSSAVFFVAALIAVVTDLVVAAPHIENHFGELGVLVGAKVVVLAAVVLVLGRIVWSRLTNVLGRAAAVTYACVLPGFWFLGRLGNLEAFVILSGALVVMGSTLGLLWFLVRKRSIAVVFPGIVVMLLNIYLFLGSGDSPFYPFAARRFVPLTIPLGAFFVVYFVQNVGREIQWRRPMIRGNLRFRLGVGIVAVMILTSAILMPLWIQRSAVLVRHGNGFLHTLEGIRRILPDGDVVLATGRAWRYAPHLLLGREKSIFCVEIRSPEAMVRAVQFLDANPGALLLGSRSGSKKVLATVEERRSGIETTRTPPLHAGKPREVDFFLTGFDSLQGRPFPALDVGGNDRMLVKGCLPAEKVGNRTFRWTGRIAWFLVPPGKQMKFVWSKGTRPEDLLGVRVTCRGQVVGRVRIGTRGWTESEWFDIPQGAGRALVEIRTRTFEPAQRGEKKDNRKLGLKIDRVVVR